MKRSRQNSFDGVQRCSKTFRIICMDIKRKCNTKILISVPISLLNMNQWGKWWLKIISIIQHYLVLLILLHLWKMTRLARHQYCGCTEKASQNGTGLKKMKGYGRIMEKIKEIRRSLVNAVTSSSRSGSGNILFEYYNLLRFMVVFHSASHYYLEMIAQLLVSKAPIIVLKQQLEKLGRGESEITVPSLHSVTISRNIWNEISAAQRDKILVKDYDEDLQ